MTRERERFLIPDLPFLFEGGHGDACECRARRIRIHGELCHEKQECMTKTSHAETLGDECV